MEDQWKHVIPLAGNTLERQRLKAEYFAMKDIFDMNLPLGKDREAIDAYFNDLHKVIFTTDEHVEREPILDEDLRPTGPDVEVTEYFPLSASTFEQQACKVKHKSLQQNMGYPAIDSGESKHAPHDNPEESKCSPSLPEPDNSSDADILRLIGKFNDHDC